VEADRSNHNSSAVANEMKSNGYIVFTTSSSGVCDL